MSRKEDRAARLGLWGALLVAACHFSAYVDRAIPAVFAPLLKAEFALTDVQIGALQGPAFAATYVVVLLAVGASRNRIPLAPLAAVSMVAWTLACIAFALAADLTALVSTRLVLGFAQAAFGPTALMILAAVSPPGRLGRATALFTAGSASGRSGAMILGGGLLALLTGATWLNGIDPWRVAIVLLTLPNLVLAWALWRVIGAARTPRRRQLGLRPAIRHIAATPALALHMAAGVAVILVVQAGAGWAPSILHRSLGLTPGGSALIAGLVVLIAAPTGHLIAGHWLDRNVARGRMIAPVLVSGVAVAVIGAALMGMGNQTAAVLCGLFLLTAGGGAAALTGLGGLAPITRPEMHGSVVSLFLAACAIGGTGLGPLLTGFVSDSLFVGAGGLADALFVTVALAGAAAILLSVSGAEGWRRLASPGRQEA